MPTKIKIALFLLLFTLLQKASAQFYSGSHLTFGKNRVQYIDRFWSYYRFDDFETYFYQQGKPLAIYTAKYFTEVRSELESRLQTQMREKVQFVIFNKMTDLKQSNIGFISDEQYNIGGNTHIVGTKVFLYFNGDYADLRRQIRAGYVHILVNNLLYGEYFVSMIKNSTLLSLPEWYVQGLISFMAEEWSTELDNYVRDGVMTGRYNNFYRLPPTDASHAGHSFWYFISQKYGASVIPNILHMTRISRSVENGFLYVLGTSHNNLMEEWLAYFKRVYQSEDKSAAIAADKMLDKKYRRHAVYSSVRVSPDGRYTAYATNNLGRSVVWLYDSENQRRRRLLRQGHRLDEKVDLSYPLMDWHPSGEILTIMREEEGLTALYFYTPEHREMEQRYLYHFDKVLHFSYAPNGRNMVVSGVINGKTNIYVYNVAANTFEVITNDSYNDLHPVFSTDGKYIFFSSNRTNDTIKHERPDDIHTTQDPVLNLFRYNYQSKSPALKRITNSNKNNYIKPQAVDNRRITFLSDENGIYNRYVARFDSVISHIDTAIHYRYFAEIEPITHYNRNIIEHYINHGKTIAQDLIFKNGFYRIFEYEVNEAFFEPAFPPQTHYMRLVNTRALEKLEKEEKEKQAAKADTLEPEKVEPPPRRQLIILSPEEIERSEAIKVDTDNYVFSSEVAERKPEPLDTTLFDYDSIPDYDAFFLPRQRNYNVEYTIDQMVNQLDFSYLNASYQRFTGGNNPIYINPGFNALFKLGLTDLLEDNRIVGGLRFSLDFNQTEFLLSYEMLARRLNRQITFYRQKIDEMVGLNTMVRNTSHMLHYGASWPFSNVLSLRARASYRYDKGVFLATNMENLQRPDIDEHWGGFLAELVFDNTRNQGYNVLFGSRYKIFGEYYRNIFDSESDLIVIGGDFRHYQKIYRNLVWANRFAASTSLGNSRLIYYMGGVDTWLFPKFNDSISVAQDQNYVYQTLATNMRGFTQNIRNGNSFALINSELRMPVVRFFSSKPLKSEFLNSLQIVGFFDIGTAWNGPSPYYEDNPFFTEVYDNHPVRITVYTQKEPIVAGYGAGLRARLFGYFLRGDLAWGIDDGVVRDPVFYLSLSLDF